MRFTLKKILGIACVCPETFSPAVTSIPVLTIDGPSGAGKGVVSRKVAAHLGWHVLDSGALYRSVGYAARVEGVELTDAEAVTRCVQRANIHFQTGDEDGDGRVWVNGRDATDALRSERVAAAASVVAAIPAVRQALVEHQLAMRRPPGLVADGRDMGTVIFPDAQFKIFLTASAAERAQRRYNQLTEKGDAATLTTLERDIEQRDSRDASRAESPLRPAVDAVLIDSTNLSIAQVMTNVLAALRR